MAAKTFVLTPREDGSVHFSLSYRDPRHSGLARISCELTAEEAQKLSLFAEATSLHRSLNVPGQSELDLEGLSLTHDPARDALWVERRVGFNSQTAEIPYETFRQEMIDIIDMCLTRARESKHGELLNEVLVDCPRIEALEFSLPPNEADIVQHRLQEITLMILEPEASRRGSDLGRMLRAKKSGDETKAEVYCIITTLADGLLPSVSRDVEQSVAR
ncbi:hypothetical protein AYJ57_21545 (plasmid) [Salipiger sp. CCB-MM3]|uniref:hypothetical protein n=1 Tax=Salipiger sp. CCB-MM3 TaxID=1792508 RepID=UPI00080A981A|nr:hypothetical protein [Salipiger sp. CCB-MM3]ANT63059.1 hypothetical protein AYJ57_21545 [Salipiger sp. CCB-MM3]